MPEIMHAITFASPGGPEVLQWTQQAKPAPGVEDVLIKVAAAGLNHADLLQRKGKYPPPPGAPDILGMEVAGEVVATGADVTRWSIGDKVCALISGGGYAEYAVAPAAQCLPIPPDLTFTQAAALPESIATVWANVFEAGALKPGETLLAHGGASGIGVAAIQMAKLFGAKIFVTVRNAEKAEACHKLGANYVIDYPNADFVEVIDKHTGGRGVDVVLDMVGGDYINRNLTALAQQGRHVSIATQQGKMAQVDIGMVMRKRAVLTGSTLRGRSAQEKARLMHEVKLKAWPWVVSGALKPLIHKVYQIKDAAEAHKMMESGAHIGKIVLEVG